MQYEQLGNCHRQLTLQTRHIHQIRRSYQRRELTGYAGRTLLRSDRSLVKVCTIQSSAHSRRRKFSQFIGKLLVSYAIDPQTDVPTGMTPMAQCAFEILALNVSAIRAN